MVVFDCWVCEGEDGTVEAAPYPESARFEPRRPALDATGDESTEETAS